MNSPSREALSVSRDAILEQLGKILASPLFQGSERSTSLLRYLVEQTASGETARLKEYTVGTEALGKGASFDPRTDPVVRAEASRLRSRLEKYYATEGKADSLIITLPKGSYVTRFQTRPDSEDRAAGLGTLRAPPGRFAWFAVGITVAICVIVLIAWGAWRVPRPDTPISIAVLPFANLSSDAEQEFFSDGITEEITSALARIPDLIVIGRTSAFEFKGQNKDLRAIGEALNAGYLIEGSVRKAGDRVRITAQLIRADSGVHIWTENYERSLNDIFATQEDIARAIAASLRVPLGLPQGESLAGSRSIDPETYEHYLRAKALLSARGVGNSSVHETVALLEAVVARAPNYAPAWALLALAHTFVPRANPAFMSGPLEAMRRTVDASFLRAESEAQRAIELDATMADGYLSLARVHDMRGDHLQAEEFFAKALAADPYYPEALSGYANMLAAVGRLKEALAMKQRALALEPFVPTYNRNVAFLLWLNGQDDAAIAMLERMSPSEQRTQFLAMIHASAGRYGNAADTLLEMPSGTYPPGMVEEGARLLRTAPSAAASPRALAALGNLDFVYLHIGAADRMHDYSERLADMRHLGTVAVAFYWHPSAAPARKSERFKKILRTAGLVDYWRAKGWPDLCRPAGPNDFVCD